MSELTRELTEANFAETISGNDTVLVDYWAPWCGPCRQFAPVYEKVAAEYPDVVFGKVNTEEEQQLAAAGEITSIPTLMAFREGILVFAQAGALAAPTLRDLVSQVQALDMDEVRAAIEQARKGGPSMAADDVAERRAGGGVPGVDYPDENGAVV